MALTDRYKPEERVVTKYITHIIAEAAVIRLLHMERLVFFVSLLTKLYRCVGTSHQEHMEREKQGYQDSHGHRQYIRCHDVVGHFVVETAWMVDGPL
jgi:hypothetical protein